MKASLQNGKQVFLLECGKKRGQVARGRRHCQHSQQKGILYRLAKHLTKMPSKMSELHCRALPSQ